MLISLVKSTGAKAPPLSKKENQMKFVLKFKKGKVYNIIKDGKTMTTDPWDRSSYILSWLDDEGKTITSWSKTGNDAQDFITRKIQQIKTAIPDMVLEHETGA